MVDTPRIIETPLNIAAPQQFFPQEEVTTFDLLSDGIESFTERAWVAHKNFNTAYDRGGNNIGFSGWDTEEGFDIEQHRTPLNSPYIDALMDEDIRSVEQLNANIDLMKNNQRRFEDRHRASAMSQIGAMALDLTNLLPNLTFLKGATFLARMANITGTNIAIEMANQGLSATSLGDFDKQTAFEAIGMTTVASLALGGVLEGAGRVANDAVNNGLRQNRNLQLHIAAMENFQRRQSVAAEVAADQRPFSGIDSDQLAVEFIGANNRIVGLENSRKRVSDPDILSRIDAEIEIARSNREAIVSEQTQRLIDEATVDGVVRPYQIVNNLNPIPTPFSRLLRTVAPKGVQEFGLNMLQRATLMLAGDNATISNAALAGIPMSPSVWIGSIVERQRWRSIQNQARSLYSELYGVKSGPTNIGAAVGTRQTLNEFMDEAFITYATGRQASSPQIESMSRLYEGFYTRYADELREAGILGDLKRIERDTAVLEQKIASLENSLSMSRRQDTIDYLNDKLTEARNDLAAYKEIGDIYASSEFKPSRTDEPYIRRNWDMELIRQQEAQFKEMLRNNFARGGGYIEYNAATKRYERRSFMNSSIEQIDDAVDRVFVGMTSDTKIHDSGMSMTQTLRYPHRTLELSNLEVLPFIEKGGLSNMQRYTEIVAPRLHFSRKFNGKTPAQVWDEIEIQLATDGYSAADINAFGRDFKVLEQRVMQGGSLANPERWDAKTARFLKQFTTLNYLTSSGLPGIADFARIIQEHALGDTLSGMTRMLVSPEFRKSMIATQEEFGDALELSIGAFHQAVSEGQARVTTGSRLWEKTLNANHILNGLGPVTTFLKMFDGALRQHTLIKYMQNIKDGTASQFEINYLNRYGISVAMARDILANAPIQNDGKFNFANVDDWEINGVKPEYIETFRAAVNSGVSNTILMATPADRPIISDGVMFVKRSVLKNIPWARNIPEDENMRGYVRLESGLMTLPFQFQAYMMGAMNKVTGAYATGAIRNRYAGIVASMGLGYLVTWARTPEYVWESMAMKDRLARAFDNGGLAPLYTSMLYDNTNLQNALGRESMTQGFIAPKFPQEANLADAITTVLGPASSTVVDAARTVGSLMDGEYSNAARQSLNLTPLWGTIGVQTIVDQVAAPFQ